MNEEVNYHTRCLITDTTRLRRLKGYENAYLVKSSPLGFVFSARIPTETELINWYGNYPREYDLSPITRARYQELLDEFEQYRKTGKILDVGCGSGFFLDEAKKRGWNVYGTEYTDTAVEICKLKGIKMQQGKLNPELYEEDMFDLVTSFEVIEHINNPLEEVQNIRRLLRPGGLFYITTPNFNALERFILKEKYNIIQYPEHLSYYTKKTLNYLLARHGFKKQKLNTTGFSLSRLRLGLGRTEANIQAVSSDELIRQKFEKSVATKILKRQINTFLNIFGIGASLKAWYIKKI